MGANTATIMRTVNVTEDCTVPYDGGSGHRYVVILKKGDELRITRKREPVILEVIARRFREGEQFYCGGVDCPGYTFEPGEASHVDLHNPGRCAAELRKTRESTERQALKTVPIELEKLGDE